MVTGHGETEVSSKKMIAGHLGLHFAQQGSLLPSLTADTSEGTSPGNRLKENQRESRYQHGIASAGPPHSDCNGFAQ